MISAKSIFVPPSLWSFACYFRRDEAGRVVESARVLSSRWAGPRAGRRIAADGRTNDRQSHRRRLARARRSVVVGHEGLILERWTPIVRRHVRPRRERKRGRRQIFVRNQAQQMPNAVEPRQLLVV